MGLAWCSRRPWRTIWQHETFKLWLVHRVSAGNITNPVFPLEAHRQVEVAKHLCSQDAIVELVPDVLVLLRGQKEHAGSR